MKKISKFKWRKLDNTAKAFSVEEIRNINTFRLSVILKEKIDSKILKKALDKSLNIYLSYRVKLKSGLFWNYFEVNDKETIVSQEKEIPCKNINFRSNNQYLFRVTYFNNKINLDMCHILTDGLGATNFLKEIVYNYLDLKYNLKVKRDKVLEDYCEDEYLKNVDKKILCDEKSQKAFLIKKKSNFMHNKVYHYILDLNKFKTICKNNNVSVSEYLSALYIYAIYKTLYDKKSNKDIVLTVPIDLRKHYNVKTFSNFFTCMNIHSNVLKERYVTLKKILNQVHKEFKIKLTNENIKKYVSRDVKLGTNIGIKLIPLFIKKSFMKHFGKLVNNSATSTVSNLGSIKVIDRYKKYIENIVVLANAGNIQRVKCTICSYENKLTVTIGSNLIKDDFEKEFYKLLQKCIGSVKLESNCF